MNAVVVHVADGYLRSSSSSSSSILICSKLLVVGSCRVQQERYVRLAFWRAAAWSPVRGVAEAALHVNDDESCLSSIDRLHIGGIKNGTE